jgi:hypothetical protein
MKKNICMFVMFVVSTLLVLMSTNAYSVTFVSFNGLGLHITNETDHEVEVDIRAFAAALNKKYENYAGLVALIRPNQLYEYNIEIPDPESNTSKKIWFHSWMLSGWAWETGDTADESIFINGEKFPLRFASSYDWGLERHNQHINIVEGEWKVLEDTSGHTVAAKTFEDPMRRIAVRIDGGGHKRRTNYVCIHIL